MLKSGIKSIEDFVTAGRKVEGSLSEDTLAARGDLGTQVDGVSQKFVSCSSHDLGDIVLDGAGLATAFIPPQKRGLTDRPAFLKYATSLSPPVRFKSRAKGKKPNCLFKFKASVLRLRRSLGAELPPQNSSEMKGYDYAELCKNTNVTVPVLDGGLPTAETTTVLFEGCDAYFGKPKSCNCELILFYLSCGGRSTLAGNLREIDRSPCGTVQKRY